MSQREVTCNTLSCSSHVVLVPAFLVKGAEYAAQVSVGLIGLVGLVGLVGLGSQFGQRFWQIEHSPVAPPRHVSG